MELSNHRKKIIALEDLVDVMKVHEGLSEATQTGKFFKGTVEFVHLGKLSLTFPSLSLAISHNSCHCHPFLSLFGLLLPFRSLFVVY